MFVYKLKFISAVHFGTDSPHGRLSESTISCHADTLFSAICQEWLKIYGIYGLEELLDAVYKDEFKISDMFPYIKEELYLPKPALHIERNHNSEILVDKKTMKNIKYIPATHFKDYINFLKKGGKLPFENIEFGKEVVSKRVNLRQEQSMPYIVSSFKFNEDAGLYFLLDTNEKLREKFEVVLDSLGGNGIGGKKHIGLGKFELYEESYELFLYDSDAAIDELINTEGDFYMALSVVAPTDDDLDSIDLEQSYYIIINRTGFVDSVNYSNNALKKKSVMMFNSGSCFNKHLKGQILDVSNKGNHKIYRYGIGMFLGVKIWSIPTS